MLCLLALLSSTALARQELPDGVVLTNGVPDASQAAKSRRSSGSSTASLDPSASTQYLIAKGSNSVSYYTPGLDQPPSVPAAQIRIVGTTAVADEAPHKVIFQSSLDVPDAVTVRMVDGQQLKMRILGLIYLYPTNGGFQTLVLARVKQCQGEVQADSTRVVYRDAFEGLLANVVYDYSERQFSQSVVLLRRPPAPESLGLSSQKTLLAVMTEVFDPPAVRLATQAVDLSAANLAAGATLPNLMSDQIIQFPTMHIAKGVAFGYSSRDSSVAVQKTFKEINGRWFLVESVPFPLIQSELESLTASISSPRASPLQEAMEVSRKEMHDATARWDAVAFAKAASPPRRSGDLALGAGYAEGGQGLVLDYILVSSAVLDLNLSKYNADRTGPAAIGYATNDFWNGYKTFGLGNTAPWTVYWTGSGGALSNYSTVTVTNGNTQQLNNLGDGMYGYFLYHLGGGGVSMTVTITNLLTSGSADNYYDLYVYGHGASPGNDENTIVSAATYLYPTAQTSYGTRGTTIWGNGWSNTTWEAGQQYVRFRSVDIKRNATNSSAFSALQLTVQPNVYGYAEIGGVQLVPSSAVPATSNAVSGLLNIAFGGTSPKLGPAVVGVATNDVWNEYHHAGVSSLVSVTNLLWSDSNASPVTMTVSNAPGEWNNGAGDNMYGPYTYQYGGAIPITFTNLANGVYDFYVYGHSPADDPGSVFKLTSGTNAYPGKGTTIWDSSWNSTNWDESMQYVVYRGVPVTTNGLITLTVLPDDANYAIINGIQINLPSPSSDTDSNLDGIPDWWCLQYGLNPRIPGLASNTAPDGLTYLVNFIQGRNPIAGGVLDTNNTLSLTVYTPLK